MDTTPKTKGTRYRSSVPGTFGRIAYAHNAHFGGGGQGQILRQTVLALEKVPHAKVFSRFCPNQTVESFNLSFGFPEKFFFRLILALPLLRGRKDWLTLLSDLEFDRSLASALPDGLSLFDGIATQCAGTFKKIKREYPETVLVLTSLNAHIESLHQTLAEEHQRLGCREPCFIHPQMIRRGLEEIEHADWIRVFSRATKQTFAEKGIPEKKIRVIYPGVDRNHFYPAEKKDKIFRVMAVGSIEPRKGTAYLLQAFEEAKIPNSELVLIGGTGERRSKKMLEGFLKRNPNIRVWSKDVPSVPVEESYAQASLLVHPALEDGFGLVVAEALSSGRPALVSSEAGASEIIREGENGFIFKARDVRALKEKMLLLANDRSLSEKMSRGAAESARDLDDKVFAEKLLAFYREILET